MALTNGSVGECDAATGADTNSGWFNAQGATPGTDYTYGAGQTVISFTDLLVDATNNKIVSSATRNFVAADVRNFLRIPAGVTGFTAGLYEIQSVAANKATLDASPAAVTVLQVNGTIKMGGSLLTVAQLLTDGNGSSSSQMYLKQNATDYTTAASLAAIKGSSTLRGYTTTRGDRSTRPVIRANGSSITLLSCTSNTNNTIENVILDGNTQTSSRGVGAGPSSGGVRLNNVRLRRFTNSAIFMGNSGTQNFGPVIMVFCEIDGCTTAAPIKGNVGFSIAFSDIHDNTTGPAIQLDGGTAINCNVYNNTGIGINSANNNGGLIVNCSAYNNTTIGANGSGGNVNTVINMVADTSGTYNYDAGGSSNLNSGFLMINCAYRNGGTANTNTLITSNNFGSILLTADPFTNKASGDFSLNNNAGGGTALRAAGVPATFPAGITSSHEDVGASQHADPVSSAGQTAFAYVGS